MVSVTPCLVLHFLHSFCVLGTILSARDIDVDRSDKVPAPKKLTF